MKKRLIITLLSSIVFLLHSCIFFAQDQPIAQIPFTLNDNGLMVISLQINQNTISDFVLDTGASVTVIDKTIAAQLGLPLQDKATQITGTSGVNNDVNKTQKQQIALSNNVVLKDLELYVSDLLRIGNIKGIIGFDLFKEFVTETNFDTKIISFYKRKGKPNTIGYQSLNFVESFCTPEIKISVVLPNGRSFSDKVTFDTGNVAEPFIFNSPFAQKHGLSTKFDKLITRESSGITAISKKIEKGVTPSIKIKNFELTEIPIALSTAEEGMLSKEAYMGNLGLQYISKFNFILDYNRKKIYLKPNKSFNDAFNFPLSGINLESKEGEIFIKSIDRPSEADEKGLKAGQQLISINGIEGRNIRFYKELLSSEGKEISITIKMDDGTPKTISVFLKRLI